MKTLKKAALFLPLISIALLSGCGTTAVTSPQAAGLSAQAAGGNANNQTGNNQTGTGGGTMKIAEASGRIGAWAKGRIGAWAKGQELDASTRADGVPNTFKENLTAWQSIHLAEAQQLAPNLGAGVKIAVIDTGIDLNHPAFQGRLTPSDSWKDTISNDGDPTDVPTAGNAAYGHGTAVANVILQLAPNAKIMPIRALTADGSGTSDNIAAGVAWAVRQGAKIINISATTNVDNTLTKALQNAAIQGVYITLAAGNEGADHVPYPARNSVKSDTLSQYALNSGAVNSSSALAEWSNYGEELEISAPGVEVATALPGGYGLASGTSFASPVLAGSLALALGEDLKPGMKSRLGQQLNLTGTNIAKANGRLFTPTTTSNPLGAGLVNVQAFLQSVK